MKRYHQPARQLAVLILTVACGAVGDAAVTGYYAESTNRGEMKLVGVRVSRGGRDVAFDANKLIGARITHFNSSDAANLIVPTGHTVDSLGDRTRWLADGLFNTGVINPGGAAKSLTENARQSGAKATPGLAVEFDRPVLNLPGDDVVVFEFHRELNSPLGGDAFHVSPLHFELGLHSLSVDAFDFDCDDPRALPLDAFDLYRLAAAPHSVSELVSASVAQAGTGLSDFKILAVAIDLSELGYADGASAKGLFFQDNNGEGLRFDPVLIAGLPEPEAPNLLAKIPATALTGPKPGDLLRSMLKGPLADVEEIVYAERIGGFDHWYANFGFYAASTPEYPPQRGVEGEVVPRLFRDGGRLCCYNLRTGQRRILWEDSTGGIRDPQVHYDGAKILFSYRRGGESSYHLYEIGSDGTGLVQLTSGACDDIEPTYLPDGGIMFCSSRCNRFVNCYRTPVAVLYRCDADGSHVRRVSTNIEHDNTPWVMPDGRVLYMRWEYVDRSQFCFHHLWTTNPDGTNQMVFFGNQFSETAMLDAKPIPGTDQVVASFSPGHGRPGHMGTVTVIDSRSGPDDLASARTISRPGRYYRDPLPVSETCLLVADDKGIHVMDETGATDLVCPPLETDPRLTCHEPRPLWKRPREPVIPSRVVESSSTATLYLSDVYHGRNMQDVERGEIKRLLILEQLPKPISFSGGMWPISVGGTFTLARLLGTVPVRPDGSAYFEVPALRSLFFVALDEDDLSVKRMQSFVSLQPGETFSCVGCHEQRVRTPLAQSLSGPLPGRVPDTIQPITDVPDVLDYPRDIQPILDRHCVHCHDSKRREGGIDLCGDHTPLFSVSYWTLMQHGLVSDGRNERYGNRPPRSIGSSASRLLELVDGRHHDTRLDAGERKTLRLWIDSSAVYAGTYAALGSGMHPVAFPVEAMERRCGECHGSEPAGKRIGTGMYFQFGKQGPALPLVHRFTDLQQIRGSIGYYKFGSSRPPQSLCNLTRPEESLLLTAPLAKKAGGLGLCSAAVFADRRDPGYLEMRSRIQQAADVHAVEKRFDMPGFQPNIYYIGKLQEYGVLPSNGRPRDPIDPYLADREYWSSVLYTASPARN